METSLVLGCKEYTVKIDKYSLLLLDTPDMEGFHVSTSDAEATLSENSHLRVSSESHGSQVTMGCKENISGIRFKFLFQGFTEILHYIQPK